MRGSVHAQTAALGEKSGTLALLKSASSFGENLAS
jgi:hypothetical protein